MAAVALAPKAPQERRERILRATIAVVRERGFAGTRVTDIALAAGTSQGLVLYHFGSLAGALAASLTLLEDEFYEELERNLSEVVGPVPRLWHIAELGAGYGPAVGDWRLWLELWVRAIRDEDARTARESLDSRWRVHCARWLTKDWPPGFCRERSESVGPSVGRLDGWPRDPAGLG